MGTSDNRRPLKEAIIASAALLLATGCSGGGSPSPDSGPAVDAGVHADGGDAGVLLDSGTPLDAGPGRDAGIPQDAGVPSDAGPADAGHSGGSSDGGCFDPCTVWALSVATSWTVQCMNGAVAGYDMAGGASVDFRVVDNQVMTVDSPTSDVETVTGLVSCQPAFYSVTATTPPQETTLTNLTGFLDPSTCMFSFQITGDTSTSPPYQQNPPNGGTPVASPEARGPYLQGESVLLPAMDLASMDYGTSIGGVTSNITVQLTAE